VTDQEPHYPPEEPEGTEPRFPREGIPADKIVGNKMGTEEDENAAHGSTETQGAEGPGTGATPPGAGQRHGP